MTTRTNRKENNNNDKTIEVITHDVRRACLLGLCAGQAIQMAKQQMPVSAHQTAEFNYRVGRFIQQFLVEVMKRPAMTQVEINTLLSPMVNETATMITEHNDNNNDDNNSSRKDGIGA